MERATSYTKARDLNLISGRLKGRLLEGSFDKRARIDLPVPLPLLSEWPFSLYRVAKIARRKG